MDLSSLIMKGNRITSNDDIEIDVSVEALSAMAGTLTEGQRWVLMLLAHEMMYINITGTEIKATKRPRTVFDLVGYVENGSDTLVKLWIDDATRNRFIKVGDNTYFAPSWQQVLEIALADNPEEN